MNWTRVSNDVNGNPRFVVHFTEAFPGLDYKNACQAAASIGGKRYRGKDYGGGIVFVSYSLPETETAIEKARNVCSD